MCQTIAELSWCHMGDPALAEDMIRAAAGARATYVKFQTWSVSRLKPGPWDHDGRRQIYEKAELTDEKHALFSAMCKQYGVKFLTSVFSRKDAERAVPFSEDSNRTVKIPSSEINNKSMLEAINDLYNVVFLSTGAATHQEIEEALAILKRPAVVLLHCVSSYPCPIENVNLQRIADLKRIYGTPVGYSGHAEGIDDAVASLEYGVYVIEKHFTTDNNLPGRDNKFAVLPEDFRKLTFYIEKRAAMNNYRGKDYQPSEEDVRNNYRGRWDG